MSTSQKKRSRVGCVLKLFLLAFVLGLTGLLVLQTPFTIQRMRMARRQKAFDQLRAMRVSLPPPNGLQDYRGAVHVHSQVSHDSLGTLDLILEGAHKTGVQFVLMGDHTSPTALESVQKTLQGVHDDVLFIPGVEMNTSQGGVLVFDWKGEDLSITDSVDVTAEKVRRGGGLTFICHSEGWPDWNHPVDGAEIFNLHADVGDEDMAQFIPKAICGVGRHPYAAFQEVYDYPKDRIARWDEVLSKRPMPILAGNDAHRNCGIQCLYEKDGTLVIRMADGSPIKKLKSGFLYRLARVLIPPSRSEPDQVAYEMVLDQYANSFSYVSTRILAPSLTRDHVMDALRNGHAYVCYEAVCEPTGFSFTAQVGSETFLMGDSIDLAPNTELRIATPIPCSIRLIKAGQTVTSVEGNSLIRIVDEPGVYRVECWVKILGEERLWILSNPIYVTG